MGGGGTNKHNSIYLFSVCIIIVKIGLISLNESNINMYLSSGLLATFIFPHAKIVRANTRSDASLVIPLQKIIKHFSS